MSQMQGASSNRPFTPKRGDGPRKVRNGIKLAGTLQQSMATRESADAPDRRSSSPPSGHLLGQRLLALIESAVESAAFAAGLDYAKAGQIVNMEFSSGGIEAIVQGTAPRPYVTRLRLPVFSRSQWDRVIDAMASEAMHVAKLLANELPPTIDDLLSSLDLALLPNDDSELQMTCTCAVAGSPGQARAGEVGGTTGSSAGSAKSSHHHIAKSPAANPSAPCKHAAAVGLLAAEQLTADPLLAFTLRGMPAEQVLEHLRRARTIHERGEAGAHAAAMIPESQIQALPLEACLDEFWRSPAHGGEIEGRADVAVTQHVPHALLRRLGPSPMNGRFPLVGLLASVYDTMSAVACQLREQNIAADESPPLKSEAAGDEPATR